MFNKLFFHACLIIGGLLFAQLGLTGIEDWDEPFLQAMNSLMRKEFRAPKFSLKEYTKQFTYIMSHLNERRSDWIGLLDDTLSDAQRLAPLQNFRNKDYVGRVFSTKSGTLVFQFAGFPNVVIKIDGRTADKFDDLYRDYLSASQNAALVKNGDTFSHLYLPIEIGAASIKGRHNARIVFSEKIPLFSDADIDNRVLLHLMLDRATYDVAFRKELEEMYSQLIRYLCKTDFDDLSYGNLPFAVDGRLAPFDTDSGLANTGVNSFLRFFFAYRVLDREKVHNLVAENCRGTFALEQGNVDEVYDNHRTQDAIYDANTSTIRSMLRFLDSRSDSMDKKFTLADVVAHQDKPYAQLLDDAIHNKRTARRANAKLFGRHCAHITDLLLAAGSIGVRTMANTTLADLEPMLYRILGLGRLYGIIFAVAPITPRLANQKSLKSYVCF